MTNPPAGAFSCLLYSASMKKAPLKEGSILSRAARFYIRNAASRQAVFFFFTNTARQTIMGWLHKLRQIR